MLTPGWLPAYGRRRAGSTCVHMCTQCGSTSGGFRFTLDRKILPGHPASTHGPLVAATVSASLLGCSRYPSHQGEHQQWQQQQQGGGAARDPDRRGERHWSELENVKSKSETTCVPQCGVRAESWHCTARGTRGRWQGLGAVLCHSRPAILLTPRGTACSLAFHMCINLGGTSPSTPFACRIHASASGRLGICQWYRQWRSALATVLIRAQIRSNTSTTRGCCRPAVALSGLTRGLAARQHPA